MSTSAYIVTGAGSGIGRAIAVKIAREGGFVLGLGRDPAKLEATRRLVGEANFAFLAHDLASGVPADLRAALGGRALRGLVNNAAIYYRKSLLDTSEAEWETYFQVNLLAAVRLTRHLYPELKAARGAIVNISSTLGTRPVADTGAYSAMKSALNNWTHTLALEWAKDGIRANAVSPGLVDTPIHPFHGSQDLSAVDALQPLGRVGRPEDIANSVWHLLTADWITGSILTVDGGISL